MVGSLHDEPGSSWLSSVVGIKGVDVAHLMGMTMLRPGRRPLNSAHRRAAAAVSRAVCRFQGPGSRAWRLGGLDAGEEWESSGMNSQAWGFVGPRAPARQRGIEAEDGTVQEA